MLHKLFFEVPYCIYRKQEGQGNTAIKYCILEKQFNRVSTSLSDYILDGLKCLGGLDDLETPEKAVLSYMDLLPIVLSYKLKSLENSFASKVTSTFSKIF